MENNVGVYYISTVTLLESIQVLQKNKKEINKLLNFVKNFEIINFSFEDILEASKIEKLRIFDALHYVLAKKVNATLVSFDKDFEGLEKVIILE